MLGRCWTGTNSLELAYIAATPVFEGDSCETKDANLCVAILSVYSS
jgi:hypothetical protein